MAGSSAKKTSSSRSNSQSNSTSHSRSTSSSSNASRESGLSNPLKVRKRARNSGSRSTQPEPQAKRARKTQSNRQQLPIINELTLPAFEDEDDDEGSQASNMRTHSTPGDSLGTEDELEDTEEEKASDEEKGATGEKSSRISFYNSALSMGRSISRSVAFCPDIPATFHQGLSRIVKFIEAREEIDLTQLESFPLPEAVAPRTEKQEADLNEFFALFCRIYRAFPEVSRRIVESEERIYKKALARVSQGASAARSTDLRAVKVLVSTQWFPGLRNIAKVGWGFHHPKTGMLLLPADINPSSEEAIAMYRADERLAFPPAELPRVFFGGPMRNPVDVENPGNCFLRSPFLVAAFCRIFLSEDDALKMFTPNGAGDYEAVSDTAPAALLHARPSACKSKSVGRDIGLENVTPHSIAYTACLLRSVLSSEEQLRNDTEDPRTHYAYAVVYQEIVDYFYDDLGEIHTVGRKLLRWWDRHVFGGREIAPPSLPQRLSMRERALAQLAQVAAAEATAPARPVSSTETVPNSPSHFGFDQPPSPQVGLGQPSEPTDFGTQGTDPGTTE